MKKKKVRKDEKGGIKRIKLEFGQVWIFVFERLFESFWRVWPQKNEVDLTPIELKPFEDAMILIRSLTKKVETLWNCSIYAWAPYWHHPHDWSDMAVQLKVSNSIVKLGVRSLEKCFKPGTKIVQFYSDSTFLMNLNVMIL